MADTVELDPGTGGAIVSTEEVTTLNGGAVTAQHVQRMLLAYRTSDGVANDLTGDTTNGLDVDVTRLPALPAGNNNIGDVDIASAIPAGTNEIGGVNVTKLAGTAVDVNSGNKSAGTQRVVLATDQPALTNALKVDGSAVTQPVSGTVTATGPLTDTQLRATAVPVSGTVTASGPLTDTQLRATAVPVSGTVTATPTGTQAVSNAGTFVTQESGAALTAMQLIDDTVFTDDAAFTVATSKVNAIGLMADQTSSDSVDEGDVGIPRMTLDRKMIVTMAPSATTEGLSFVRDIDLDETETAIKATAGKLYGWYLYNDGASEVYVKVYNATTATVVVGTTVPDLTIPVPAGSAANVEFTNGIAFTTAITAAATTLVADNDATAPAANQVVANFFYQ